MKLKKLNRLVIPRLVPATRRHLKEVLAGVLVLGERRTCLFEATRVERDRLDRRTAVMCPRAINVVASLDEEVFEVPWAICPFGKCTRQ